MKKFFRQVLFRQRLLECYCNILDTGEIAGGAIARGYFSISTYNRKSIACSKKVVKQPRRDGKTFADLPSVGPGRTRKQLHWLIGFFTCGAQGDL